MRSRTELVTTQLEGSDFEDESDFEDSEEDWKPAKGEPKPKKIKSSGRGRKSAGGNKNGAKKRGRKPSKKSKKKSSDEDNISDDDTSEPESAPARKPRKTPKKPADSNVSTIDMPTGPASSQSTIAFKSEPTTSTLNTAAAAAKPQPLQRKIVSSALKSFPDKCGYLNLYIFKGDLKDGIADNAHVCLWRRDGSSLLQKYLRDKTVLSNVPQFNSSMVYSCWEDRRADEYLEVKVRCLEQSKQIRVELTDIDELEAKSKEEYDNYVATYGTPVPRSSKTREGNSSNDATAADGADDDDDDDEECDEDDIMDEAGDDLVDGEGEEYEEVEEEEEEDETEEVPQEE